MQGIWFNRNRLLKDLSDETLLDKPLVAASASPSLVSVSAAALLLQVFLHLKVWMKMRMSLKGLQSLLEVEWRL